MKNLFAFLIMGFLSISYSLTIDCVPDRGSLVASSIANGITFDLWVC